MIKKLSKLVVAALILVLPLLFFSTAHADNAKDAVCQGIGLTSDGDGCNTSSSDGISVESLIHTVISLISYAAGIIAVVMIVISGFKYMTAGGESSKVTSAKSTLMHALIGLAIAALAQVLVRFVFTASTKDATSTTPSGSSVIRKE